ncbi:hypothetical protein Hanom_Chr11g01011101 [Helianthus anomalus]
MHRRIDPSFFFTKRIGAPQGDELGRIKPFSNKSSNCVLNFFHFSWCQPIRCSCNWCCSRNNIDSKFHLPVRRLPGNSSGKTSEYSAITGMSSIFHLFYYYTY